MDIAYVRPVISSLYLCTMAAVVSIGLGSCQLAGTATNVASNATINGNLVNPVSVIPGSPNDTLVPSGVPEIDLPAITQSGSGWSGSVNIAAVSENYEGLSLDQLAVSTAGIGEALRAHPEIVSAIRLVNEKTQVPGGLLAGVIYQESGFDVTSVSSNPNPTPEDTQDVGLCQCPQSDFVGDAWKDPYTNINIFVTKYFLPDYVKNKSWGFALRDWNTGEVLNPNDLSQQNNSTDPNYVVEILATHCMGLD